MNTIKARPEFASLSDLEIQAAIDAYDSAAEKGLQEIGDAQDAQSGDAESTGEDQLLAEYPIAAEFMRLVTAYTDRLDELIVAEKDAKGEVSEGFLADLLSYEPGNAMECAAFDFVTGIFIDAGEDEE